MTTEISVMYGSEKVNVSWTIPLGMLIAEGVLSSASASCHLLMNEHGMHIYVCFTNDVTVDDLGLTVPVIRPEFAALVYGL